MRSDKSIFLATIILALTGCSKDPIELVNSSWDCKKKNNKTDCTVNFTIKNNDDFVQHATVKIRAHRKRRIDDAVANEVVGENTLNVELAPKEQKNLKHNMILEQKLTQIVVSAYIAK